MQKKMDRLNVKYQGKPCYDIVYRNDFEDLPKELMDVYGEEDLRGRNICIITDSNVDPLYGETVKKVLAPICNKLSYYVLSAGEEYKNLDSIAGMYRYLIAEKMTRKDILVALGGGVVGDMTGFCAASYLRGIDFVQIPTTLLSQVDSSIGGKTGVDFEQFKNMVGAFHMPRLVYSNTQTLLSLDERQYASGFAEVMKHGLIADEKYYWWLVESMYEIEEKDVDVLREMVYRSNIVKKNVVEEDPTEKGIRAHLNLGHTIGHGIEKASDFKLLHGECVALGCIAAADISVMHGLMEKEEYLEIRDMFVPFKLPITLWQNDISVDDIIENTKSDKKNTAGSLKFILLNGIGEAGIFLDVTEDEMRQAIEHLMPVEEY